MARRMSLGCSLSVLVLLGALGAGCSCGESMLPPDVDAAGTDAARLDGSVADGESASVCGDSRRARDEVCDDGNTVDGDGCSADCQSDETCGNSFLDMSTDELCDDGNMVDGDGCRGDCLSDYLCGNGVTDTVASGGAADEVCDDGNSVNGDGCSAACDSDESCGNSIVDVAAGEVCDDGNTAAGDDCSADCTMSLLCGNGVMDGVEECDDDNTVDGDGCGATCFIERCGNGRLDPLEICDDGNPDENDGCRTSCTFTCATDAECADTDPCNGDETCANPGTGTSMCVPPAAPAPDGTACGSGLICLTGLCATSGCGDAFTDTTAGETCDDGNTVDGDGCDSDCTFTCASDADCSDGAVCNGTETCSGGGTTSSACAGGAPPADGTTCGAGQICSSGACVTAACGDGLTTGTEACDDGNTADGDGCDADCTFTCTAAADCSDSVVCNGTETCTGGGTLASRCGAGTPPADGTTCGGANICRMGSCVAAACGDGIRTGTEACDDGNAVNGDGCQTTCTFTCTTGADCTDGLVCNGTETCTGGGTLTSRCGAGTPPANGTSCGGTNICRMGACVAPGCGDGVRTGTEQCDDGNMTNGDGCQNACTWTCTTGAECTDGLVCNGTEACTGGGTLASRCNAGTPPAAGTSCGGANICRMGSCVAAFCGDGIRTGTEQCDDGNAVNTDGCRTTCTWTCATGADCTDGLVCNGTETCTMGGTIGSRCNAGAAPPAGTSCGGTNICRMGSCVAAFCGDGIRTGTEQCDDGNAVNTDGCRTTCTWTCATGADCTDGLVCNGTETCTMGGTIGSRCNAGAAPPAGTSCGGANICVGGTCVAARCGDSIVTAPEVCDDANLVAGDGCENSCQWTCTSNASCIDANTCNGSETCASPSSLMSRCNAGAAPPLGTLCDADAMPATRDICRTLMCLASVCGDGYVDAGRTPPETCDDSNTTSGDGCSSTCQLEMAVPPTGFRITNLDLISPRITVVPLFGCSDATQNPVFGFSVNGAIDDALAPTPAPGTYSLHIVSLFRPLNPAAATTPSELHFNPVCMQAPTPDSCAPAAVPDVVMSIASNQTAGTCFTPVAADVNTRAGTPAAYAPTANTVSAPCFITSPATITVTLSGIVIPLQAGRVAGTYSGGPPPNRLVSGIVTGFLSERDAADIILPASLPVVGNTPLYTHLQAGNRAVMNSMGMSIADGCNVSGGTNEDDADMYMGQRGFWFFLNFTADQITWTGP